MFSWQKPDPGVIKLNVDGSRVDASGRIGAGEVLDPEIWGLYSGFKLASENNSAKLIIESDFAILVKLILDSDVALHPLGSIVLSCRALMDKFDYVSLRHIFRECNKVADSLAKNSLNHDLGLVTFDSPPVHAGQVFLADLDGFSRARRSVAGPVSGSDS